MESTDVASTLKGQEVLLNLALHTAVELLVEKESARRIRSAGFCGCLPSWWQSASRSGFCCGIGGNPLSGSPLSSSTYVGAGDPDWTGDLRFTNGSKTILKRLGVSMVSPFFICIPRL